MIYVSKKDQQKECRNLVDDGFSTLLENNMCVHSVESYR